ncbi:spore coat protein CotJB [[Clostridium] symbiosum]
MSYFNQMAPKREQLLKDFAANFEPLTVDCISKNGGLSDHFTWLDGPAPWEGGAL